MAESLISPGVLSREQDRSFIAPAPLEAGAAFIGPTVIGPVEEPTVVTSYGDYQSKFGVAFESGSNKYEFLTSLAVKSYFEQGGNSALITRVVNGSFTGASNSTVAAADAGAAPFSIQTLGKGAILNNSTGAGDAGSQNSDGSLVDGSAENIRWEIGNVDEKNGTFSLLIRRGDDNLSQKTVLESFNDLSLDPNSEGYIAKIIGDQYKSKSTDGGQTYISTVGSYVNRSNYIRVASVDRQTLNYLANDGVSVRTAAYTGSLPVASSGSFHGATGNLYQSTEPNKHFSEISAGNTQGLEASDYADAISILTNQDEYVFNIVSAPGLIYSYGDHKTQLDAVISLASSRGDNIAVVDLSAYGTSVSNAAGNAASVNSSYAATYWPWLQMQSSTGKLEFEIGRAHV